MAQGLVDTARHRFAHGRRRAHARRRLRPPRAPLRHGDRQPRVGGRRDGRRQAACTRARRRMPICSGACAAAAATSASSRASSSGCIRCSARSSPGRCAFPIARARDVLSMWADYAPAAPDELYFDPVMALPPGGAPGRDLRSKCAISGPPADAERALAPLRKLGTPEQRHHQGADYVDVQRIERPVTDARRASARISRAASSRSCPASWCRRIVDSFQGDPGPHDAAVLPALRRRRSAASPRAPPPSRIATRSPT